MEIQYIHDFLKNWIGNEIGVCALMGNLYVESHLMPNYLEGVGTKSEEYIRKVNSGEISRDQFCHDGKGFGLAQWTYWSRKQGLYDLCKEHEMSIDSLDAQLMYLWSELQKYKTVAKAMAEATDLRTCSDVICLRYEKPEHTEEKYLQNRANFGQQFYEQFIGKKEDKGAMNSAAYVDQVIAEMKLSGKPLSDQVWEVAKACEGWAYVFGAYGEYCDPSNRRSRYNPDHQTIKTKCKNFNGKDTVPAGCVGCKWFLGGAASDERKHEGRTRFFDCRGYVYFVLRKLFNFWPKGCPAGATSMWNTASNWAEKGLVKDGVPNDTLVCLFYPEKDNPKKMAHIGFGYKGQTLECSSGVEFHSKYDKKWTHWAIPKCVVAELNAEPEVGDPSGFPTLRQGSQGDIVKTMQQLLKNAGSNLTIDGIFGNGTKNAVIAFQKKNGLEADGVVGPMTWAALVQYSMAVTDKELYTVTLSHVPEKEAAELLKKYAGSATPEVVTVY